VKIFRLILFIAHIGLLLLLIGVLLNAYVPPKVFPWFNLLSLGFPVLIIGYVLLTFFWIFSWKKRAFVFMFLGLFFLNPVKRWVNYSPDRKEIADLKVVTFNIKAGTIGYDKIKKYLDSQNADIIFLQEFGDGNLILNNLEGKKHTNVIKLYTKYKIVNRKNLLDKKDTNFFAAHSEQIDIDIKGKTYRLINAHLESFKFEKQMVKLNGDRDDDQQKLKDIVKRLIPTFKIHQEQVETIRKSIDESPYPVILAGDLNSVPNSYEYYHLGKGLNDAFFETGKGSGTSFHDYKYPLRIDFIFTSPSVQPVTYKVDRSVKLSDHFPVISTFKLE
jgi:endonuclease/exonuclease/phosphatase family metal-dependent hydrolase